MKKSLWFGLCALCLSLIPLRAQSALLDNPQIISVISVDEDTCALEVEILDLSILPANLQVDSDPLLNLLVDLAGLNLAVGDIVLLASPSFETLANVDADVLIDEDLCISLQANAVVKVLTTGLTVLDSVTLPAAFDDLTALLINPVDGVSALVDLSTDSTPVANSGGGSGTVGPIDGSGGSGGSGNGGSGDGDGTTGGVVGQLPNNSASGGGCSMQGSAAIPGASLAAMMVSLCVILGLGRRAAWNRR